jgi:hypothetical protein
MEKRCFFSTVMFLSVVMSLFTTIGTYLIDMFGLNINPLIGYIINFIVCYFIVLRASKWFWIHVFGACDEWMDEHTKIFSKKRSQKLQTTA